MRRDEDPPEDEQPSELGSSPDLRWREQISRDDLRRRRAQGTEGDALAIFATEQWIDEFCRQYSRALMEFVCRYAARLLSLGGPASPYADDPHALASDALSDTLSGRRLWDPTNKELRRHLLDIVRRRISRAWERAKRLPHVSIDAVDPDGEAPARDTMEDAMRERLPDMRDEESARDDLAELRQRAADDADVLALIRARQDERFSRADAMSVTGFSHQRYRAALRRLNRIVAIMLAERNVIRNSKE